jgi:UDP-3-O-[3-hydroxymyristoyl] glucosamine N-acyltransferase
MRRTTREIAEFVGGELHGDPSILLDSVASLKNAREHELTYAEEKFYDDVKTTRAGCVITASAKFKDRAIIVVKSPKVAFARAAAWLLLREFHEWSVHPTAIVAADVRIGNHVNIGAGAVLESGVVVGDESTIEAGCYLGTNTRIGSQCILYPRVVVYRDVEIGNRVIVHAGAVIGADGFGFVRDGAAYVKFPQVGKVVIADDVEIGANTCIDRGSLETTVIRQGVKLDNLVQIAHNVEVGEHTVIAAQTGVSGSCTIGPQSVIGGQVGMGEHAHLDPGTIIGGQGGVLNSKHVRGGEVLWGTPVRPLKEFLAQQAHLARLPKLAEEVRRLRDEVDKLRAKGPRDGKTF